MASKHEGRLVHYDKGSMVLQVLDCDTGEIQHISRTSYWEQGDPPCAGTTLDLIYTGERLLAVRLPLGMAGISRYAAGTTVYTYRDPIITGPVIFLAGPIQGTDDWQEQARLLVARHPQCKHVTIANPRCSPRTPDPPVSFDFEAQVDWESRWLRRASQFGVLLFWLAKETVHLCHRAYAQTSRWELSEWKDRLAHQGTNTPLVVGIEPGFSGERYMRHRLSQDLPHLKVHATFDETVNAAIEYLHTRWPATIARLADPSESKGQAHTLHDCNAEDCNVCSGGLSWCTVCGGAEGSMPTECPGSQMTAAQSDAVHKGSLDFKGGRWTGR